VILALMPTTKTAELLSIVHEDTQDNAAADHDEAVTCAQWDATAHWNTSDWKRFAHSLVNHGFIKPNDFSLSAREVCEAKDEENEQAELALTRAEEELATESSPGLTAHEMSLSSVELCWRARKEVAAQTRKAKKLLDAAIKECCTFSDQPCAKDLTKAREALLESVQPLMGAAKAQHILDNITKNYPPLLKGLLTSCHAETKHKQLMALSAQLRDVVVWNICSVMEDPKDRDFFLMMLGQAFLPHASAKEKGAQILLAYHRIDIYKFHGFTSNNGLVRQRLGHPRAKRGPRKNELRNIVGSHFTRNQGLFSQQWPQYPQCEAASSPSLAHWYIQMWDIPVPGTGPHFLNTDLDLTYDPPPSQKRTANVLPAPIKDHSR